MDKIIKNQKIKDENIQEKTEKIKDIDKDIIERLNRSLLSKEQRQKKQKEIIALYNSPIISFMLNIPGKTKTNELIDRVFKLGFKTIEQYLVKNNIIINYKEMTFKETGNEAIISVHKEAVELKKLMINLEETLSFGRILDIDVFDENFNQISRSEIGEKGRKCLLCQELAVVCIKNENHSHEDILNFVEKILFKTVKTYNKFE